MGSLERRDVAVFLFFVSIIGLPWLLANREAIARRFRQATEEWDGE